MKNSVIIDVREPIEFRLKYIEGSFNYPLSKLDTHMDAIGKLCCQHSKIFIVCRSGMRALSAHNRIVKVHKGTNIHVFEGGITAWEASGREVSQNSFSLFAALKKLFSK